MCLIIFAYKPNPRYHLVVAANRDEFYGRPTAPADFWEDVPSILAGRDLKRGGTWMGVTEGGRTAAITNYRDPNDEFHPRDKSRGFLVADFLKTDAPPSKYLENLRNEADEYDGFNLLAGDGDELWWYSNRDGEPRKLEPGVYGLSNAFLDTPWPKVERGKRAMERLLEERLLEGGELSPDDIFPILADDAPANDEDLPDTGVSLELERMLSAPFIRTEKYGTRCSTALVIERDGKVAFAERRFQPGGHDDSRFEFLIQDG